MQPATNTLDTGEQAMSVSVARFRCASPYSGFKNSPWRTGGRLACASYDCHPLFGNLQGLEPRNKLLE